MGITKEKTNKEEQPKKQGKLGKAVRKYDLIKSLAHLIEMSARTTAGLVLVNNFDHRLVIGVGYYLLITAGMMLVATFIRANK